MYIDDYGIHIDWLTFSHIDQSRWFGWWWKILGKAVRTEVKAKQKPAAPCLRAKADA